MSSDNFPDIHLDFDADSDNETVVFDRFFTLEEAAAMLGEIRHMLAQSHAELRQIQDDIVLYKRMHDLREDEGADDESEASQQIRAVLKEKWNRFDGALHFWEQAFQGRGILLKSLQKGLMDFPYKAKNDEIYLLCWHYGEEGILFFHGLEDGFAGRRPITLLPE